MNTDDQLHLILIRAGIVDDVLDASSADRLAESLGLDPVTADEFTRAISKHAVWDGEAAPDGEFEFRVGHWHLDLRLEAARAAVMTTILGALFATSGTANLGVAVLAAIVPSLFNLERVSLSDGDRLLLMDLRTVAGVTDRLMLSSDLYEQLPAALRDRTNQYDFADFLERLRVADEAVGDEDGRLIRIRRAGEDVALVRWN